MLSAINRGSIIRCNYNNMASSGRVPQILGRRFRLLVVLDAQRAARLGKTAMFGTDSQKRVIQ